MKYLEEALIEALANAFHSIRVKTMEEEADPDSIFNLKEKRAAVAETINKIEFEEDYKNGKEN